MRIRMKSDQMLALLQMVLFVNTYINYIVNTYPAKY